MFFLLLLPVLTLANISITPLNSGIIFQKTQPVVCTSSTYTINADFNLAAIHKQDVDLEENFSVLEKHLNAMQNNTETVNAAFVSALHALHYELSACVVETQQIFDMLPHNRLERTKRGWFDGLGKAISGITGLMDADDSKLITEHIEKLRERTSDIKLETTAQKTIIHNILENQVNNTKLLGELASNLFNKTNSLVTLYNETTKQMTEIRDVVNLESKLRTITFLIQKIKNERQILKQGLQSALEHKLTPNLIKESLFSEILKKIEKNLPKTLQLLSEVTSETLPLFFLTSECETVILLNTLRVTVRIPTKQFENDFSLYKIFSVPWYIEKIRQFATFSTKNYVLMDKLMHIFTPISEQFLSSCQPTTSFILCKNAIPLITPNNKICEYNLFTSHSALNCEKSLVPNFSEYFIKVGEQWLFSVDKPTKVAINCEGRLEFRTLTSIGLIQGAKKCRVASEYHVLQPSVQGQMSAELQLTDTLIPLISNDSLFNHAENKMLSTISGNQDLINRINQSLLSGETNVRLSEVLQSVVQAREGDAWSYSEIHIHGLTIFVIVVGMALCFVAVQLHRALRTRVNVETSELN